MLGHMAQMVSRFEFQEAINWNRTEYHTQGFRFWSHFVAMLFFINKKLDSICLR